MFHGEVRTGLQPRQRSGGNWPLGTDDWKLPVEGRPEWPRAWRLLYFERGVVGRVSAVHDGGTADVAIGPCPGLEVGDLVSTDLQTLWRAIRAEDAR